MRRYVYDSKHPTPFLKTQHAYNISMLIRQQPGVEGNVNIPYYGPPRCLRHSTVGPDESLRSDVQRQ